MKKETEAEIESRGNFRDQTVSPSHLEVFSKHLLGGPRGGARRVGGVVQRQHLVKTHARLG